MRTKLLATLVVSAAAAWPGVALADPPSVNPGKINKIIKKSCGTPGQNVVNDPPAQFAQSRNTARKSGLAFGCVVIPPPVPGP